MRTSPQLLCLSLFCAAFGYVDFALAGDDLEHGFASPPESAKPRTWWHWVSGNVSAEGITADLEAMKRIGLGGAQIFTVDQSAVHGPIEFMSADWRKLVHHALDEADRLHLEISMEGCDGWSESGGPWVQPDQSMQKVVWTQQDIQGGKKITLNLPQPTTNRGYYEDISLFAFPTVASDGLDAPLHITASDPGFDGSKLIGPDAGNKAILTSANPENPMWIQLEYAHPVTLGSMRLIAKGVPKSAKLQLEVSDDGSKFIPVNNFKTGRPIIPMVTGKFYRLGIADVPPKTPIEVHGINILSPWSGGLDGRTGIAVFEDARKFIDLTLPPEQVIDPKSIVDLSGKKEWDAPAGNWTIIRLGHTSTGITTHPSTKAGLECDKMSEAAVTSHFKDMFGPVMSDSPDRVGTTLKYMLLDSWEAGCENWTPRMAEQFKQRRGYDLAPWLPVLAGYVVGNPELSQRFLWDYRRTLADLVAEEHYGTLQILTHQNHMGLTSEAPGIGRPTVADGLQCKGHTDIPMGEFWVNKSREENIDDPKEAASAGHIYGKNIIATESFTSTPQTAAWKNDPYSLKALGDQEFCLGVNRFVFHRYAHQPWLDRQPGMSMGPWGINFERTNTWWEPGSAWISYLTRSEYLLQQGTFAADLCYFYGEDAPVFFNHQALKPAVPAGYDYDACNVDVLQSMQVVDGRIVLPSGMSYRVLVLPDQNRMSLPVLEKVQALVQAGAVIYGPKPLKSPSLTDYPDSDQTVTKIADKVWGPCDGQSVTEHACGKGKIVWGESLDKALDVEPDFSFAQGDLLHIHRRTDSTDIYFISNQQKQAITTDCTFRVDGKVPELWHSDTGEREVLAYYKTSNGLTTVPIHFDPVGSVFVIFQKPSSEASPIAAVKLNGQDVYSSGAEVGLPFVSGDEIDLTASQAGTYDVTNTAGKSVQVDVPVLPQSLELKGSWQLSFPPKLGAPEKATFDSLTSWSDSTDDGIKYFSGTATYSQDFSLTPDFIAKNRHVYLNLGDVKNLAEVTLNGKSLGILWKAPFEIEMTSAATAGTNHLEVKVTNLWPNRLIGDQKLPEDKRITWASVSLYKADDPLLPSGLLGPVTVRVAQDVKIGGK